MIDESELEHDLFLLKSTVVTEKNMSLLKEVLVKTQKYRMNMLKDTELDLLENFPCFFSNPELVSIGFNYGHA